MYASPYRDYSILYGLKGVINLQKLEELLQWGGLKREAAFLILSGAALILSMLDISPFPFDMAWTAIILCGIPIILEAVIGLITAFDIKADVLVSIALILSLIHI